MMTSSSYERERKRIEEEIWSLITVENAVVIDCGVGKNAYSTRALIEKGAHVIVVDKDTKSLVSHRDLPVQLIQGDVRDMPFKKGAADALVFCFTLHETDPAFHWSIVSEAARIASRIMIVEPTPGGDAAYQRYTELWKEAMHKVGKFEDYQPPLYWTDVTRVSRGKPMISTQREMLC